MIQIENEFKFVLKPDCFDLRTTLRDISDRNKEGNFLVEGYDITQKYLNNSTMRLRKEIRLSTEKSTTEYICTTKIPVDGKTMEFENTIVDMLSRKNFDNVWHGCEGKTAKKYRYYLISDNTTAKQQKIYDWVLDFYYDDLGVYFALAEVELPEDMTEPPYYIDFVVDNLLYAVPQKHNNIFSATALLDRNYANQMLVELFRYGKPEKIWKEENQNHNNIVVKNCKIVSTNSDFDYFNTWD